MAWSGILTIIQCCFHTQTGCFEEDGTVFQHRRNTVPLIGMVFQLWSQARNRSDMRWRWNQHTWKTTNKNSSKIGIFFFSIAYRGESKNRLKFLCLPKFQSHNTLRVNYIQLQRKSNNFHGFSRKGFWGWESVKCEALLKSIIDQL